MPIRSSSAALLATALALAFAPPAARAQSRPVISSFRASPSTILVGQTSTLLWSVSGATDLTISPGANGSPSASVTGITSYVVAPTTTTTYILTATNDTGITTAGVTIMAGKPPTITAFTAYPNKVASGQPSTLSWSVTGFPSISISPGVGVVGTSSIKVYPSTTVSYTMTATNSFGKATASVTVTAGKAPTITSFTATPAKIVAGQTSKLAWVVTGSPTLTVSPGVGTVTGTFVSVKPSATTTYTLTATNPFGSASAVVPILVGSMPSITSLTAAPAVVTAGGSSTLNWIVTNATTLVLNPAAIAVTGTSYSVSPTVSTYYTLTATNTFGSVSSSVRVIVGNQPSIASFAATPSTVALGHSSTLSWAVTGSPSMTINQGVGAVTGTSVRVTPAATTIYTLTATNAYGSASAIATVGVPPTITSFTATPSPLTLGGSTTLAWSVTGSPGLIINPGVGAVTGTSKVVTPAATTTYTLTATNSAGTATATVTATVLPPTPPVINSFVATPATAGTGVGTTLVWSTNLAAALSIDHGVGTVTGNSIAVNPTGPTTYTLTATNALGSVTATAAVAFVPLHTVNAQLYYTEHAAFIIPPPSQVTWTGGNSWGSVYSTANMNSYVATLKSLFPDDFVFVVVAANNLTPNSVPSVSPVRHVADGIAGGSAGTGVPSVCRYNIGGGAVTSGAFGVLDHEIGHIWGVFLYPLLSDANGHWYSNSTATGQMAGVFSDDSYTTVKQISGDPSGGFVWTSINNITKNETETFSANDLYLQGLNATFPDIYVFDTPVYNSDQSVTYNSLTKYDQAYMAAQYGARNPSYQASPKRLRAGFVYVARDLAEVQSVFQTIEQSANQFVNAEQIDTANFRFQVPFLVDTQYRASLDALLADLDGNTTPTLTITGSTFVTSTDGTAVVPFTAADADGPAPTVSCVPASASCGIQGSTVVLTGLASGSHFFTIKAQDTGGKKTFAHFVVDVQ